MRFRTMILAVACLALASCGLGSIGSASSTAPPAPLASTQIDDKALVVAFDAYDTVLDAVDALIAANILKPETPRALKVANALETAKNALNAAREAQLAGSAQTYEDALRRAQNAFLLAQSALGSN